MAPELNPANPLAKADNSGQTKPPPSTSQKINGSVSVEPSPTPKNSNKSKPEMNPAKPLAKAGQIKPTPPTSQKTNPNDNGSVSSVEPPPTPKNSKKSKPRKRKRKPKQQEQQASSPPLDWAEESAMATMTTALMRMTIRSPASQTQDKENKPPSSLPLPPALQGAKKNGPVLTTGPMNNNESDGEKKKKNKKKNKNKKTTKDEEEGEKENTPINDQEKKKTKSKTKKKTGEGEKENTPSNDQEKKTTTKKNKNKNKKRNGERYRQGEERWYGRFHCKVCSKIWESSQVYTVEGTFKVKYKQRCKTCPEEDAWCFPFKLEPLKCGGCWESILDCVCECDVCHRLLRRPPKGTEDELELDNHCFCKDRMKKVGENTNPDKPHHADLCERCIGGRPCRLVGSRRN